MCEDAQFRTCTSTIPKSGHFLGLLYSRNQGQKNLGPTSDIFGLQIGLKLLINVGHWSQDINWNIGPKVCKLASPILWYSFFSLGANTRPLKFSIYWYLGQIELKNNSALTSNVKFLGLISTFAPRFGLNIGPNSYYKVGRRCGFSFLSIPSHPHKNQETWQNLKYNLNYINMEFLK